MASSACVHFIRNNEVDEPSLLAIFEELHRRSIIPVYVDYLAVKALNKSVVDEIASLLPGMHAPYPALPWVAFLDDLVTLSHQISGLVIVLDNADSLLEVDRGYFFDLIESFLVPIHHWFGKSKPCHLCLQMERNERIGEIIARSIRRPPQLRAV